MLDMLEYNTETMYSGTSLIRTSLNRNLANLNGKALVKLRMCTKQLLQNGEKSSPYFDVG